MGYIGQRMSERAAAAYNMGEMPLSKWTKGDIISRLKKAVKDGEIEVGENDLKRIQKFSGKTLKTYLLKVSSWHHTGKFFNKTDFYDLVEEIPSLEVMESFDFAERKIRKELKKEKKEMESSDGKWAIVKYFWEENRGSKKWPKIYDCQRFYLAKIKGKSAEIVEWGRLRKVYRYSIVHEFEGKPRKNAKELKMINDSYKEQRR